MAKTVKVRKNNNSTERGYAKNIILSLLIGIISFVAVLAIFSVLILNVYIETGYLYLFVLIGAGISSFTTTVSICRFTLQKKLILSLSASVLLAIIEFLIILCFNNASLSNFVYLLFPIVIIFGFTGCVIGTNIRKK